MTDAEAMARALTLARAALGRTAPNPAVGAVLVRDGVVLGEGSTSPAGGPHAEVMALASARDAGHDPRGATLFVTLEPCCHHGRTPPCTVALLEAGIARAVVGVTDPNPVVRGKGIAQLRAGGVSVDVGLAHDACERQILGFARAIVAELPQVTVKVAATLDGRIATAGGESQWITSPEARADGRLLRGSHDAILVGIGTALADDPRLTARLDGATDPVPVVLDSRGRLHATAQLLRGPRRAVVLTTRPGALVGHEADILTVPADAAGRVDITAGMRELARRGLHRVLVEGGGEVVRSLFDARLVDDLILYQAGLVLPGGRPWLGGSPVERLADGPRLTLHDVRRVGPDVRLHYTAAHCVGAPLSELEG